MTLYAMTPACWAPGLDGDAAWKDWLEGRRAIERTAALPPLSFTAPLFRRRLSQLSRMTVQVVHDALELAGPGAGPGAASLKQSFVSFRGELARQLSINRTLITEQDVLPASFSLSVFNTPMALASMACGLTGGYSVLFPSADAFYDGFCAACAPSCAGRKTASCSSMRTRPCLPNMLPSARTMRTRSHLPASCLSPFPVAPPSPLTTRPPRA